MIYWSRFLVSSVLGSNFPSLSFQHLVFVDFVLNFLLFFVAQSFFFTYLCCPDVAKASNLLPETHLENIRRNHAPCRYIMHLDDTFRYINDKI